MQTVICVLKSGGVYDERYVENLRRGIEKHCDQEFNFVCLTDLKEVANSIPLEYNYPGWWSKLELFRPDLDYLGDFLFFDLDTIITGSIDIFFHLDRLVVLRDFYKPVTDIGSGMMYIPVAERKQVWNAWIKNPELVMSQFKGLLGDQAFFKTFWMGKAYRWQDLFKDKVLSYKKHNLAEEAPQDASVVCFHGVPKPHTLIHTWTQEYWQ